MGWVKYDTLPFEEKFLFGNIFKSNFLCHSGTVTERNDCFYLVVHSTMLRISALIEQIFKIWAYDSYCSTSIDTRVLIGYPIYLTHDSDLSGLLQSLQLKANLTKKSVSNAPCSTRMHLQTMSRRTVVFNWIFVPIHEDWAAVMKIDSFRFFSFLMRDNAGITMDGIPNTSPKSILWKFSMIVASTYWYRIY